MTVTSIRRRLRHGVVAVVIAAVLAVGGVGSAHAQPVPGTAVSLSQPVVMKISEPSSSRFTAQSDGILSITVRATSPGGTAHVMVTSPGARKDGVTSNGTWQYASVAVQRGPITVDVTVSGDGATVEVYLQWTPWGAAPR